MNTKRSKEGGMGVVGITLPTISEIREAATTCSRFLKDRFTPGRHHVASLLVCEQNSYFGLHLDCEGFDHCAEVGSVSQAVLKNETDFRFIVSTMWDGDVRKEPWIIPPCGDCRQFLFEYTPSIFVGIEIKSQIIRVAIKDLLPYPYSKPEQRQILRVLDCDRWH